MQNDYHRWKIAGTWMCIISLVSLIGLLLFMSIKNQLHWTILLFYVIIISLISMAFFGVWLLNRIRENPKDYRNILGWPDIWPNEKKKDSGHYAYPFEKRIAIVEHYFQARKEGEAKNKDIWADEIYGISGKTLGEYIKEYQTQQRLKKATEDTEL